MTTLQWTIIPPEDDSQNLWRYLTFEKFEHLIRTSELYLRRLDKFIDEYEGKLDAEIATEIHNVFNEFPDASEMQRQLFFLLKNLRTCIFTNCWHQNDNENIEMWKTYCGDSEGVLIGTDAESLVNSILAHDFGPMHFRPVTYGDKQNNNIKLTFPLELVNYKQDKYRFENEYRISLFYIKGDKEIEELKEFEELEVTPPEDFITLKIDLNTLIKQIRISPFANDKFRQKVNDLCEKKLKVQAEDSTIV
jgi:hypothetical protein